MNTLPQDEVLDGQNAARRKFLAQVVGTGAAAALPLRAQPASAQAPAPAPAKAPAPGTTIAEILAQYATTLKYEDLPPEVVRLAKRVIIDTLGCAIGGYSAEPSQIAVRLAAGVSAANAATVICSGARTSPELAVFANGVMMRYLDFNDGYIGAGSGHPSDAIAAVLSTAEVAGRSGRDLILGTVLAYEVFCKFCDVFNHEAVGMDYATVGGFSGAVGASRMMGLTQPQMVHAISLAVAGHNALRQTRRGTLSNWKACSCAEACRNAVFAAQLAQAGMTAPAQVFEGSEGFFNMVKVKPFTLPKLGEPFGITRALTKRFALGQYAQTVAQAASEARPFFKDINEIAEVNLQLSKNSISIMADSPDKWRPQTRETADHSIPYAAGVVLMYGTIDEHYYDDEFLRNQRLLDLVARVKVIHSDEADRRQLEGNLCELELVLKSGARKTVRVEYHRGHFKNPMTDAEIDEKFRALARRQLSAQETDALLRQLWALEDMPKAGALVEMTRVA
jgi:2-methylcitrate dehydratase